MKRTNKPVGHCTSCGKTTPNKYVTTCKACKGSTTHQHQRKERREDNVRAQVFYRA